MRIPIIALRVLDQDRALAFYTENLGFTVTEDMDLGAMRWLTVAPPGAPDQHVLLERVGPPIVDPDTAETIDTLIAKGVGGTLFLEVDDCRALFDDLVAKGVDRRGVPRRLRQPHPHDPARRDRDPGPAERGQRLSEEPDTARTAGMTSPMKASRVRSASAWVMSPNGTLITM